jgi:2-keto-4-pentenoate hydratase/2-oxohepta-3-ene-1,7-dioic acid hydratase in catechol pathway
VHDYTAPNNPVFFNKPSTSVIGTGESIIYPPIGQHVDHEAELAIVIGKLSKNLTKDNWMESVLGFTIANDLSERVLQGQDGTFNGNFTRAKSFDTFCPLGPVIQTNFEQNPELGIKCYVNDELKQDGNTRDMIFSIGEILEFVSSIMTLLPGDVVLTGTPDGVSKVQPGDEIKIEIETIGTLINPVK